MSDVSVSTAVAKDHTVHRVGCVALNGLPGCTCVPAEQRSIAYREGLRARQDGVALADSAIKNLRVGSRQYDDYLAGYDSLDASESTAHP